jgi:hypothetical protein
MMEAKVLRTINLDTPDVKVSLFASLRFVWNQFVAQSSTITTDATTTDTSGISQLRIIENHPLVPVFGVFQDDPTWADYMQNIEEYRTQINALENSLE